MTLNKYGKELLGKVLPTLYEHLGQDIMENVEAIL